MGLKRKKCSLHLINHRVTPKWLFSHLLHLICTYSTLYALLPSEHLQASSQFLHIDWTLEMWLETSLEYAAYADCSSKKNGIQIYAREIIFSGRKLLSKAPNTVRQRSPVLINLAQIVYGFPHLHHPSKYMKAPMHVFHNNTPEFIIYKRTKHGDWN